MNELGYRKRRIIRQYKFGGWTWTEREAGEMEVYIEIGVLVNSHCPLVFDLSVLHLIGWKPVCCIFISLPPKVHARSLQIGVNIYSHLLQGMPSALE